MNLKEAITFIGQRPGTSTSQIAGTPVNFQPHPDFLKFDVIKGKSTGASIKATGAFSGDLGDLDTKRDPEYNANNNTFRVGKIVSRKVPAGFINMNKGPESKNLILKYFLGKKRK